MFSYKKSLHFQNVMGLNNRTGVSLALLTLARLGLARLGLAMMGSARVGSGWHKWTQVSLAWLRYTMLGSSSFLGKEGFVLISRVLCHCIASSLRCFIVALLHHCIALSLLCFIIALLYRCFASSLHCFIAFAIFQALQASHLLSCDLLRWRNNVF